MVAERAEGRNQSNHLMLVQGVPKKLTNRKKLSASGLNFLMSMTWERLILLRVGKKQPKNIFPDTRGAGY